MCNYFCILTVRRHAFHCWKDLETSSKKKLSAFFPICILWFQQIYCISVEYFLLLNNLIYYFWSINFNTDHYFYMYLQFFWFDNIFSHYHFSILKEPKKVRGKHKKAGFYLTSCWLLWRRPTHLCNFLVSRNYHHIGTVTSKSVYPMV